MQFSAASLLLLPTLIRAHLVQTESAALPSSKVPAPAPSIPPEWVAISTLLTATSTTTPEAALELREVVDPNGQPVNAQPGAVPGSPNPGAAAAAPANGAAAPANGAAAPAAANQPAGQPAAAPANGAAAPAANQPANPNPAAGAAPLGGAAAPAGQNPVFTQVSPVTTIFEPTTINGVVTQVAVVYSQKFSSVPNQGPTPVAGSIGLGTISGTVGAVRTKAASSGTATRGGMVGLWGAVLVLSFVVGLEVGGY